MKEFPDQRDSEVVVVWVHKHLWVFLKAVFLTVFLGSVIVWGIGMLMAQIVPLVFLPHVWAVISLLMTSVWMLGFVRWIDEEFDSLIITNERIISTDQAGLFQLSIAEASLDVIQEINTRSSGFLESILNMGNMEIQTAAKQEPLKMETIWQPAVLREKILNTKEDFIRGQGRVDPLLQTAQKTRSETSGILNG